jgi:hypothetical protein
VGIEPDIVIERQSAAREEEEEEPSAHRMRERDLERHLPHQEEMPPGSEEEEVEPPGPGEAVSEDLQLARALEVLKSWTYFERLETARESAAALASAQTP